MPGKKPGIKSSPSQKNPQRPSLRRAGAEPAARRPRRAARPSPPAVPAPAVEAGRNQAARQPPSLTRDPLPGAQRLSTRSRQRTSSDTAPPQRRIAAAYRRAAGHRRGDGDGESESAACWPARATSKPYVAKRGEQYMSKEQLAHFQQILLNWKRDLMEEVDRTVSHMKDEAANFPDPNDRATQEEEFSLELRTRDRERKLIRKIEEALKRIEDGTYGYCLETGEEIGIKRLEARPVATLSIEAQERRERRERQYGDRDDRYR